MPELTDSDFLELNGRLGLISEQELRSAREKQREEAGRRETPRSLVAVLRESGVLTPEVEILLREGGASGNSSPTQAPALESFLKDIEDRLSSPPPTQVLPRTPAARLSTTPPSDSGHREGDESRRGSSWQIAPPPDRPPEVEAADLDPKNRLSVFVLLEEVGRGGMGKVYRAWDNTVGRIVAIKVIETDDPESRVRFVREAQVSGNLHHPSIATIFQAGEDNGRGYIAMQFIEGKPVEGMGRPIRNVLELIRDVAHALSYAHEKGIIHRDIKPGNLMVDQTGKVFVTDFGLAKLQLDDSTSQVSVTGSILGTPQFMSPEQAKGEGNKVDARSDIYSLGATLYSLLAGRPPFIDRALGPLLMKVIQHKHPPLSQFNTAISPELEAVIERSMAKNPKDRFPTAAAFAEEIDRLIREERFTGKFGRAKQLARRWLPVTVVGLLLGLVLRYALPRWASSAHSEIPSTPLPVPSDPTLTLLKEALSSLETLETGESSTEELHVRIGRDVLERVEKILAHRTDYLPAQVARVRALYVDRQFDQARKDLERLAPRFQEDYRLPYLKTLFSLESALAGVPPLPALEAPSPEWDAPPENLAGEWVNPLKAASSGEGGVSVPEEFQRDVQGIKALAALAQSQWEQAADLLAEIARTSTFAIYRQAWCRAAYLAKRFPAVAGSPYSAGLRERIGARMAMALASSDPLPKLCELIGECGSDSRARAILNLAVARLKVAVAEDPGEEIKKGLEMLPDDAPMRGTFQVTGLLGLARAGRDSEGEYREALKLIGDAPPAWVGRLASVEGRIGLGSLLQRHRKDSRPPLEEAVRLTNELGQRAPEWLAPRLLRAAARIKLGQFDDAWAELQRVVEGPVHPLRGMLLSSTLWLELGEEHRKAGQAFQEDLKKARKFAVEALGSSPGHPEGLSLSGAASLIMAQDAASRGEDEGVPLKDAIDSFSAAIARLPGFQEALHHRARALFMESGMLKRSGREDRPSLDRALADVNLVLAAVPESLAARYLRGILQFARGETGDALADWKWIQTSDPRWNASELDLWIRQAESRLKVRK
jgi:serine/threonine protein kinase